MCLARLNKALTQVLNKILLYCLQFSNKLLVKGTKAKGVFFTLLNLNFMVIQPVRRKHIRYYFGEYVFEFLMLTEQFLFYQLLIYKLVSLLSQSFFFFNHLINFVQASCKGNSIRLNQVLIKSYNTNIANINWWEVYKFLYSCLPDCILRSKVYSPFQLTFHFL